MVAVASTANLELDQLLNEASSEDGEDSRESANLEDILASDDSNASEDEAVSRIDRRTSSEADRLLALILDEEDEGGGVMLTPPESQAEAALLSPGRRQAELHALLRRADETLGDPEPDAAASRVRMPEAPPATAAPPAPHQWPSEGARGLRCGGTGDDGGTAAAAAAASPVAAPAMLASGLTASEARTVAERAVAAAAAAATATDAARGGVALAEAAEVRPSPSPSPSACGVVAEVRPSPSPSPSHSHSPSPSPSARGGVAEVCTTVDSP